MLAARRRRDASRSVLPRYAARASAYTPRQARSARCDALCILPRHRDMRARLRSRVISAAHMSAAYARDSRRAMLPLPDAMPG